MIKPPFPWFGGKSRASDLIWERLGDVKNYVEPFAGSLAVLLNRPHEAKIETVNDIDHYLANFWRAVKHDPDGVAEHADNPVNEADKHARHYWLITEGRDLLSKIIFKPDGYDSRIAGWWVWGISVWIGGGWCSGEGPWVVTENGFENLRNAGQGVNRQLPHLRNAGQGVNRQLPHLRNAGQGVNRQLPHLGDAGREHPHREHLIQYMRSIQHRIRYTRVACGDWKRVLTPSVTFRHGMTGIVLDPPYGEGEMEYAGGGNNCNSIANDVAKWAIENGDNPNLRIALCGYEGQYDMPDDWVKVEWTSAGGYSSTASGETQGKLNRKRERVWFSPNCLNPQLKTSNSEPQLIPA